MRQASVYLCRVHTAEEVHIAFVALLAMVGYVYHDGILVLKLLHNLRNDRVVIQNGVVVVGKCLSLAGVEVRLKLLVVVALKVLAVLRRALAILHVLTEEVEDNEVVVAVLVLKLLIVAQQSVVKLVQLRVAGVKLCRRELGVVEEETAAEVVHRLLSLGQELVGDERNVVASLAEHSREERIVAPLALVAHSVGREDVLEHEACKVPRTNHIGILNQASTLLHLLLSGCCRHNIAILAGVVAVVALAYNQHDIGRAERARVDPHLIHRSHKSVYLLGSKRVGVYTEHKAVYRLIEHGMVLLGKRVLHLANGLARHKLNGGCLVVRAKPYRRK